MVKGKPTSERPSAGRTDSLYKGVRKRKWGKWVSEIRLPNSRERIWLGSYDSPEKAARAFDAALFCLRGRNAKFNFPENPPQISGGGSLTPPEIRVAAARFANEDMGKEDSGRLASELQLESPSPSSVSDGVAPADSDFTIDWSLLELLTPMVSDGGVSNFVDFPDIHGFPSPQFPPPPPPTFDYDDENFNDGFSQQSFLWNF